MTEKRKLPTGIYLRGNVLWAKVYQRDPVTGKSVPVFKSTGTDDVKKAARFRAHMLLKASDNRLLAERGQERVTIDELLEDTISRLERKHRGSGPSFNSHKWALQRAKKIREYGLGALRAVDLTTTHIEQFQDALLDEEYSPQTVNHFVGLIRTAFHDGFKHMPAKIEKVPYFPMLEVSNVRKGFLLWPEYEQLRDTLDPSLRTLLVVLYHLGLRRGEALGLTWNDNVIFDAPGSMPPGTIRLNPLETKNGEARNCIMYGDLYAYLKRQRAMYDAMGLTHGRVFFWFPESKMTRNPAGSPIKDFRESWDAAVTAIGKPDLIPHDMRRSAVSNMIERMGFSAKRASTISGHKTLSMIERYHMLSEGEMREMYDRAQGFYERQRVAIDARPKVVAVPRFEDLKMGEVAQTA